MDEAAIERAGTAALKPLLAKVAGVKDARTWLAALVELHKLGIFVVGDNHVLPELKSSTSHVTKARDRRRVQPDRYEGAR
jgi:predicted metalloendopeptidase